MALISRLSQLFKADMHAVLDRIEAPDVLLNQAIREMEEAHSGDRARFELLSDERQQLRKREERLRESLKATEEELDLAFGSGDEALLRSVMRRKLERLNDQNLLQARSEMLGEALQELERQLGDQAQRLEEMRRKSQLLSRDCCGSSSQIAMVANGTGVSEQAVELALLREKARRNTS